MSSSYPQPYNQAYAPQQRGNRLQTVRSPCDINGPLAEGSAWPYECLIFPASASPAYAMQFMRFGEVAVAVVGVFTTVLSIDPGENREGRIISWGCNEVNAAGDTILPGTDLEWQVVVSGRSGAGGSRAPDFDIVKGQWCSIAGPIVLPVKLERAKVTSLQVRLPAGGGAPRTLRALLRGWMGPFIGGGTFASGAARS